MRRNNNVYVVGPTEHWTLVYITEYDNNDLNKNPISCLALPDTDKIMDGTLVEFNKPFYSNQFNSWCIFLREGDYIKSLCLTKEQAEEYQKKLQEKQE